jgi:hypothetical protein
MGKTLFHHRQPNLKSSLVVIYPNDQWPRACMYYHKCMRDKLWFMDSLTTPDCTTLQTKIDNTQVLIVSCYMDRTDNDCPPKAFTLFYNLLQYFTIFSWDDGAFSGKKLVGQYFIHLILFPCKPWSEVFLQGKFITHHDMVFDTDNIILNLKKPEISKNYCSKRMNISYHSLNVFMLVHILFPFNYQYYHWLQSMHYYSKKASCVSQFPVHRIRFHVTSISQVRSQKDLRLFLRLP